MSACHYCGKTESDLEAAGKVDPLRPYGPGGTDVCFDCAMGDPERESAAKNAFGALLDGMAVVGEGVVTLGGKRGPEPGLPDITPEASA